MIHTIAFDADDTLWENLTFFSEVEANTAELLSDFCDVDTFKAAVLATEKRNVSVYGYGIKTFTLCLMEAAWEVSDGRVQADTLNAILTAGRNMLRHPLDLIDGVEDTLTALSGYRLVIVTKGDLFHQEAKIEASGLSRFFDAEHVVSEKLVSTYRGIFGGEVERCVMIGNSLGSDVKPMLDAKGWAIHVPHDLEWEADFALVDDAHPKLRRGSMREVPGLIEEIEMAMRA